MVKKTILQFLVYGIMLLALSYGAHAFINTTLNITLPFSLLNAYLFLGAIAILICLVIEIVSRTAPGMGSQLGSMYLVAMAVKIMAFCGVYYEALFGTVIYTKTERLALLIPVFVFLIYEVVIIAKILNRHNTTAHKK